jgi:cytochrome c oxidase assembly protein subunit 15
MRQPTPPDTRAPAPETIRTRWLAAGFAALVVLTVGLIVLGALVRAHDAGLACPDWPLCFGELIPRINLRVGFEWSHRVVAAGVSLCFLGLGALVLRRPATRDACRGLLAAAAALLALQVLLGALTVWQLLASWTVTAHLLTGNGFAVALLWTALMLRDLDGTGTSGNPVAPARHAVAAVAALLVLQMLLGGLVSSRYAGLVCPEWPACREGVWLPTWRDGVGLHLFHRWNAVALLAALAVAARTAARRAPALRRVTALALALGVGALGVGIANVLLEIPVEVTGLHSALAAALVLCVSVAVRECWFRDKAGPAMLQSTR